MQQSEIASLKSTQVSASQQSTSLLDGSSPAGARKRSRGDALQANPTNSIQQQARELEQQQLVSKWEAELSELQSAVSRSESRAGALEQQRAASESRAQQLEAQVSRLQLQLQQQQQQLQIAEQRTLDGAPSPLAVDASEDAPHSAALRVLEERLTQQRTQHAAMVQELQQQLTDTSQALQAAQSAPTGGLCTPAAPPALGDGGLAERCSAAERETAALRKQMAAAERRQRRLQATMDERSDISESLVALRDERNALQQQVARLQASVQGEARCTAALQRAVRAATDATQRLTDMHSDTSDAVSHGAVDSDGGLEGSLAWSRLAGAVDAAVHAWTASATAVRDNAQQLGTVRAKLVRAERQATENAARASALEGELATCDSQRIQAQTAAASAQRRIASLTREVEAMEALVASKSVSPSRQAAPAGGLVTPVKGGGHEDGGDAHLAAALKEAREEIKQLQAQASSEMTPNAAVGKLRLQLDTAQEQLAATQKQLTGALAAQEKLLAENAGLQHQVGRGDFNSGTTKVLHLKANPLRDATQAAETQKDAQLAELQAEMTRLRTALQAAHAQVADTAPTAAGGSDTASVLNESTAYVPAAKLEQALKKTDRLMTVFKERMKTVKDGLYEITGWKMNVDQRAGDPTAVFRFASQFAEREGDELKFQFAPGGEVSMLETTYCPARVDPRILMLLQVGSSGRLPAFLASLTLDLHGKQTIA